MWDLERTCVCCNKEGVWAKDLGERPDDPVWQSCYCSNVFTLDALRFLKNGSSGVMRKLKEAAWMQSLVCEVRW